MGCTSSSKLEEKNSKAYSPANSSSNSSENKMSGRNTLSVSGPTQFPSLNSQQRLGGSPGKVRNKVALKPGRSLMDWIRLGNSGKDLTGLGQKGKYLEVSQEELEKHNTVQDAWISLRGKVYNISPYLEYHPGGEDELMRGAGKDGTELFDEVHKWVNYESMLEKCFIGKLKTPTPVSKRDSVSSSSPKIKAPSLNGPSLAKLAPPEGPAPPRFDWYQNDNTVTIVIYTRWKDMQQENVIMDQKERIFQAALYIEQSTYFIHLELENTVTNEIDVKIQNQTGKTEIVLHKDTPSQQWSGVGKFLDKHGKLLSSKDTDLVYRRCCIDSVSQITHDSKLFCVRLPQGFCMRVPIGYHIHIRHTVSGMEIVRSYTAVLPSLLPESHDPRLSQGKVFYLMIKIYKEGALTPWLESLHEGDEIEASQFDGNFQLGQLSQCDELVMYAAGTGFTPMVRLIHHCLSDATQTRKVKLMFFNKKEKDIIWREQLDSLADKHERFSVKYVLSEADDTWTGTTGRIRKELMEDFSPQIQGTSRTLICACGPTPFTNTVIELAKDLGYKDEHCHAFLG